MHKGVTEEAPRIYSQSIPFLKTALNENMFVTLIGA
jgi:hypothetical protein